jgi:hypothetical protein
MTELDELLQSVGFWVWLVIMLVLILTYAWFNPR